MERLKTNIMTLYRYMYSQNTHLVRSDFISNSLGLPTPHQLIAQQTVSFIHRVITKQKPVQIFNLIEFPARNVRDSAPRLIHLPRTKKGERTLIFEGIRVYANLPKTVRDLPEKMFINHVKEHKIDLTKNPT